MVRERRGGKDLGLVLGVAEALPEIVELLDLRGVVGASRKHGAGDERS